MDNLQEAVDLMRKYFYKVIKVNVKEDCFVEIVKTGVEDSYDKSSYSEWINSFIENGYVHKNDVERFKTFSSLDYISSHTVKDYYRKLVYGEWRWVCFECEKCQEDDCVMVYVRDVNDSRVSGLLLLDELKKQGDRDSETGTFNYHKLVRVIDDLKRSNPSSLAMVVLTMTKYINCEAINFAQVLMHAFGKDNVFRIDENVFVSILPNVSDNDFSKRMMKYYRSLRENNIDGAVQYATWTDIRRDGFDKVNDFIEKNVLD